MTEGIFNTAYGIWNSLVSLAMTLFTTSPTAANSSVYSTCIRIVEQTRKSFLKKSLEVLAIRIFCLMIIQQIYTHGNHQQRELSL